MKDESTVVSDFREINNLQLFPITLPCICRKIHLMKAVSYFSSTRCKKPFVDISKPALQSENETWGVII